MSARVFSFNRLRDGVERNAHEQRVHDTDHTFARRIRAIVSYDVIGVEGALRDSGVG